MDERPELQLLMLPDVAQRLGLKERHRSFGHDLVGETWELRFR